MAKTTFLIFLFSPCFIQKNMMLICDDFQLVNQFSERNDNSHKETITFEIHEVVAQRLATSSPSGDTGGWGDEIRPRNGTNPKPRKKPI
jgi:hypothetical protein